MRIVHRVTDNSHSALSTELRRVGVHIREANDILTTFEIDESDHTWPAVQGWIEKHGAVDVVSTSFSVQEIRAARWLEVLPAWHWGYPQPDPDHFGFLEFTYDLSNHCNTCGIGARQVNPFMMGSEPSWGRRGILQLNWVFDEYFVRPQVWKSVLAPTQSTCRAVLGPDRKELSTVVQIVVTEQVDIQTTELSGTLCPACARVKYLPFERGPFPTLKSNQLGAIVRTSAYFGSGSSAWNAIVVSQEVARAFMNASIRGVEFRPVSD